MASTRGLAEIKSMLESRGVKYTRVTRFWLWDIENGSRPPKGINRPGFWLLSEGNWHHLGDDLEAAQAGIQQLADELPPVEKAEPEDVAPAAPEQASRRRRGSHG
ncbi:MAG: hypothetical protein AB1344_06265 [Pseudomonadota bacterium]